MTLWTRRTGPPTGRPLVLLHGLGATSDAFGPLAGGAARRWPGPCVLVDLPGHGRSAWDAPYTTERLCAAVGDAVPDLADAVVVGHSLGGVVAVGLAAGTAGTVPAGVVAVSVKSRWEPAELERGAALGQRPRAVLPTEDDAAERFLAVAGLAGLLDGPALRRSGVVEVEGGWSLAQDPATNAFAPPSWPDLLAAARCPVRRATGERDPVATPQMLHDAGPDGVVVAGAGHNLHVEHADAVLDLALEVLADL